MGRWLDRRLLHLAWRAGVLVLFTMEWPSPKNLSSSSIPILLQRNPRRQPVAGCLATRSALPPSRKFCARRTTSPRPFLVQGFGRNGTRSARYRPRGLETRPSSRNTTHPHLNRGPVRPESEASVWRTKTRIWEEGIIFPRRDHILTSKGRGAVSTSPRTASFRAALFSVMSPLVPRF